jgi:hypothetical protein
MRYVIHREENICYSIKITFLSVVSKDDIFFPFQSGVSHRGRLALIKSNNNVFVTFEKHSTGNNSK